MATIREMMGLDRVNFETVDKDFEKIITLFSQNDDFLRLLHFNSRDAISNPETITDELRINIIKEHVRINPEFRIPDDYGSFVIVTFDHFVPNEKNPEYMDNLILIDVICPTDLWNMDSYMSRPFRIQHQIMNMLRNKKLNGIGKVQYLRSDLLVMGDLNGYQMVFAVINND